MGLEIKKKLYSTLLGVLFVIANKKLNLGVSDTDVTYIVSMVVAYVIGQGLADAGKEKTKLKQTAEALNEKEA